MTARVADSASVIVAADRSREVAASAGVRSASREEALTYRPDIDGLRAVAIASVLAFHAHAQIAPGGFMGVDVFLVISGFLITGILASSLARGTFSYTDFYARRIRRIFPALIVVLLFVWACGWLKLFPDEFTELGRQTAAGALYLSNVLLYRESGYFDAAAEAKPLLHLWSLGVEEQFYILWPALLALTWRWRRARLPLLLAIAGGSFLFNVARVATHPAATFYLLPTRLWELALGGLLASRPARALPAALSNPMAGLGAALVLGAVFALDRHRSVPGIWALVPTLGTALVIAAGEGAWINRRVLASGPAVFLGLISYPLYLWHWPLLSLMRIIGGSHGDGLETFTALALAVLLAVLTWYLLERPLRGVRPATRIAPALFTVLALIGVLGVLTVRLPIAPLSARYGFERILAAAAEQQLIPFPGPHLQPMRTAGGQLLRQGTAAHSVLFLGDSNVEQYYPRIDALLLRYGARARSAVFASDGGCVPIPGVREPEHAYCDGLVERARAYARSSAVDTVVIAAAWARYFGPAAQDARDAYYFSAGRFSGPVSEGTEGARRALASLAGMVSELVRLGKRVVIVLQIPTDDALDPRAMIRRSLLTLRFTRRTAPLERAQLEATLASVDAPLRRIARDSGAVIVDPFDSLCDRRSCPALTPEGEPMYRDDMHLRPSYVREHVRFLDVFLLEP